MKCCMIASLGASPPVVCEVLETLIDHHYSISDVVLLCTESEEVKKSALVVEKGIEHTYPHTRVHEIWLPFEDVRDEGDLVELMRTCAKTIRRERELYGCERVFLNLTGGRKGVGVCLSILGQMMDIDGLFYAVHFESGIVNVSLERIRYLIDGLYESEDKDKYYQKNKDELERVLFPPKESYNVIELPCLPYPNAYLGKVATLLSSSEGVKADEVDISENDLKRLESVNLITRVKDKIYPTELGGLLSSLWR